MMNKHRIKYIESPYIEQCVEESKKYNSINDLAEQLVNSLEKYANHDKFLKSHIIELHAYLNLDVPAFMQNGLIRGTIISSKNDANPSPALASFQIMRISDRDLLYRLGDITKHNQPEYTQNSPNKFTIYGIVASTKSPQFKIYPFKVMEGYNVLYQASKHEFRLMSPHISDFNLNLDKYIL